MSQSSDLGTDPNAGPHRAAVLGMPIAHSLSPALHRAAYDFLGLPWSFQAIAVDEAALPAFVAGLDASWRGLALTMPLKRAVLPLLDSLSDVAAQLATANTVVVSPASSSSPEHLAARTDRVVLRGDNTDAPGLVAAFAEAGLTRAESATVLGGGATATSALWALSRLGVSRPQVIARDPSRCVELVAAAARMGVPVDLADWHSLPRALDAEVVVATTPPVATTGLVQALRSGDVTPRQESVLFDVLYHPWPTPLAQAWTGNGGRVLGGLDLLVHQAVLQIRLMTGRDVPVGLLRAAGERELAQRREGNAPGGRGR